MDQKARFIQKAVRDTLLQRLLKGRAREVEALPELLREFGVCFRSDRFAVLGLRLCGPVPQGGRMEAAAGAGYPWGSPGPF